MYENKKVFVACPLGSEESTQRARSDKLLKYVINPVVEKLINGSIDEIVVRADKLAEPGRLTKQIIREINNCDVLITDLTDSNPNVMYELGLRQALLKPYILMAERGHKLPFDISDFRTIFYTLDLDNVEAAQSELEQQLSKALDGDLLIIDQELLTRNESFEGQDINQINNVANTQILEASNKILSEMLSVKDLVLQVGQLVLDIRDKGEKEIQQQQDRYTQELGITVLQQLFANPESMEKIIPVMEALSKFNEQYNPDGDGSQSATTD